MRPNHAPQRLERFGESVKGILLHAVKQKAEGRVYRSAHESTVPRPSRGWSSLRDPDAVSRDCHPRLPRAGSLSLGR